MKKYWPHLLNIALLLYYIIIFIGMNNIDNLDNSYSPLIIITMLGIALLLVIGIWVEIIYFLIYEAKNKKTKNYIVTLILIYMLNIFYIPCYYLKYFIKDEKSKIKNIIYSIISILLTITMYVVILKWSLEH